MTTSNAHPEGDHAAGSAALLVAATDAPPEIRERADYRCDGEADEAEINAALEAARSVTLSEGTFTIGATIRIAHHGQRLAGQGTGQSPDNSDSGGGTLIQVEPRLANYDPLQGRYLLDVDDLSDQPRVPRARVLLRDFTLHAHGKGDHIGGIHFRGHQGLVENVWAVGMSGDGIVWEGFKGWQTYDCRAAMCQASYCRGAGFRCFDFSADSHFSHLIAHHNEVGFHSGGASHQISGLHAYANATYGIHVAGTNDKIVNGKIEHNRVAGLFVTGGGTLVSNCGFKAGQQNPPDGPGASLVKIDKEAYGVTITGCRFEDHADGNDTAQHAIDIDGDVFVIVNGCNIAGTKWRGSRLRLGEARSRIIIANCNGIRTQNSGAFTTDGSQSYQVEHGLSVTPRPHEVMLTPQGDMGSGVRWWVSAVDDKTFTVAFAGSPDGPAMSWRVESTG